MAVVNYCPACLTTFREDADACTNLACGRDRPKAGWGRLLDTGDLLDRHYRIHKALAVAGAGITYLAQEVDADEQMTGPELAIKVLYHARATGSFLTRLSTEAQILQELDHPHIIRLRAFVHRTGSEPYLVTLFEQGGTLTDHIEEHGALPLRVATDIICQILKALDVAHQRGVVHRDLKPDNVLLEDRTEREGVPHIRVADFGIAKVSGGLGSQLTKVGAFVGTPEYAAPEQFDGMPPTPAADVFAAGAVFVHLLTGRMPVDFSNRADIEACKRDWMTRLPFHVDFGDLVDAPAAEATIVVDTLAHMMTERPEKRWTVSQVIRRLQPVADGSLGASAGGDTVEFTANPAPKRNQQATSSEGSTKTAVAAGVGLLGLVGLVGGAVLVLGGIGLAYSQGWLSGEPAEAPGPVPTASAPVQPVAPVPVPPQPVEPVPDPEPVLDLDTLPELPLQSELRMTLQAQLQAAWTQPAKCPAYGPLTATVWAADGEIKAAAPFAPTPACASDRWVGQPTDIEGRATVTWYAPRP